MYTSFFGFTERPFDVTPDPKFLYLSPQHTEMLASLEYGIRERRGFITVFGEAGTGKTTLLNAALDRLDPKTHVAFIYNTDIHFEELLKMTLMELGLTRAENYLNKPQALDRLNRFAIDQMAKGGNVVLIVDEAQNLDHRTMENLRLLSNLETPKQKLIQIILSGQPELDRKLHHPSLRQLAQRINLRRYITPLGEKETYEYVQHRLAVAGYSGPALFKGRAQELIWEYSGGIPRKINVLCDNALLIAFGLSKNKCDIAVMKEAIKDLSWSPFSDSWWADADTLPEERSPTANTPDASATAQRKYLPATFTALAVCLVFLLGLWLGKFSFSPRAQAPIDPKAFAEGEIIRKSIDQPVSDLTEAVTPPQGRTADGDGDENIKNMNSAFEPPAVSADLQSGEEAVQLSSPKAPEPDKTFMVNPFEGQESSLQPPAAKAIAGMHVSPENTKLPSRSLPQVITVKPGDMLSEIIRQTYGNYNEGLVNTVLRENPAIWNADQIFVGQRIILPEIQELVGPDTITTTAQEVF